MTRRRCHRARKRALGRLGRLANRAARLGYPCFYPARKGRCPMIGNRGYTTMFVGYDDLRSWMAAEERMRDLERQHGAFRYRWAT